MHPNTNENPAPAPTPIKAPTSDAQMRAKYLCQDCGQLAPSGFGLCNECGRRYA